MQGQIDGKIECGGTRMDPLLGLFLRDVRQHARAAHRPVYEELVWSLETHRRRRRRRRARLCRQDFMAFLAYGYVRQQGPLRARAARRLGAATRVLASWWTRQEGEPDGAHFMRQVKRAVRGMTRAARASELLDQLKPQGETLSHAAQVDDYFQVVVRGASHVVVRTLGTRLLLGPVAVTEPLAAALDPGVWVNLCLAQREGFWQIIDTGSCYPPAARNALAQVRSLRRCP